MTVKVKVELIYDLECPQVNVTREHLRKALHKTNLSKKWIEWDRNDPQSPEYARGYGSPTILVNGKDIAGQSPSQNNCCRLYHDDSSNTLQPAPSVSIITAALLLAKGKETSHRGNRFAWKRMMIAIPSVFVALLPQLTCPLCWPAYAGILSVLGISFVNYTPYLLPLFIIFLFIALFTLGYRAKRRRGYKPLFLGLFSTFVIILGKFVLHHDLLLYSGVFILMAASFWNSWPMKKQ